MNYPVANWNISGNVLTYLEKADSNCIWLVKLFIDKEPGVFKISIPQHITQNQVNSIYNSNLENFVMQPEHDVDIEETK